jgi:hypothetical protein
MAFILADRVQELTSTTGTGTLTLTGAVSGFQSFGAIGDANTTYYTIVSGTDWEVGYGTYTAAGTTLSRDTILSSSAGGAAISVAAGASVFCDYPAGKAVTTTDPIQLVGDATSTQNIATAATTGGLNIGGAGAASGTITIGRGTTAGAQTVQIGGSGNIINVGAASGIQPITIGRSGTSLAVVNINSGAAGGKTTNIATNATSGTNTVTIGATGAGSNVINVATGTNAQTVNISTGATTNTQTINIANGVSTSSKAIDIGGGGASSASISIGATANTTITIGVAGGTTTTAINGPLTANSLSSSSATITGGTINNATIGATTASTGAFTYISTSSSTSTTPTLSFNASNSPYAAGATISGSYLQHMLQNKSATANASTNYVLSNDSGTDTTFYGEFGMNSSVFSASTPADYFSINNGVYFSAHDGDVTIGSGNGFKTYLAWGTTGQSAHVINASGAIGLNTNLGTTPALSGTTNFGTAGQVLVSAGNAATATWSSTPTLTGTNFTGIPNGGLTNSTITFGATSQALGSTVSALNAVSIGASTASTGIFTQLTVNGSNLNTAISPTGTSTVTIAPGGATTLGTAGVTTTLAGNISATTSNQTVTLSPTGTGTVAISPVGALTVNPTAASTINNCSIGVTTPLAGSFTSLTATSVGTAGVLAKTGGKTAVTAIAATTTLTTGGTTLASQTMATGATWRVVAYGTFAAANSATARTFTMACFWGATQLTAITTGNVLSATAQTTPWKVEFEITGSSATAAWVTGFLSAQVTSATIPLNYAATAASTTGLTTTSTLDIRFANGTAAIDAVNVQQVTIERIA